MGFFFTVVYVFVAFMAPETLFGSLAQYHIQVAIAGIAILASLPKILSDSAPKLVQMWSLLGLTLAVALSFIFSGWPGGMTGGLAGFVPDAAVFFLVLWNFRTKLRLQVLVVALLFIALFITYKGWVATEIGDAASPYVVTMGNDANQELFRIRGLTFLSDPNDLAQFMLMLMPLLFLFWHKGRALVNFVVVLLPCSLLLFGMFLTHSRGAMIAMVVAGAVALRNKVGLLPSVVVGGLLFVGLNVVGWSGGREVGDSAERIDAWAAGLTMIKSHPLFGVGFNRFTEFHELTAHNTLVVCAAELGIFGLFFWMLSVIPTVRDVYVVSQGGTKEKKKRDQPSFVLDRLKPHFETTPLRELSAPGVPAGVDARYIASGGWKRDAPAEVRAPAMGGLADAQPESRISDEEIRRMCSLMVVSLAGFLTSCWFLSRAYTMATFLCLGMAAAIYSIARERGIAPPPLDTARAAKFALVASVSGIVVVWVFLRIMNLKG